MPVALSSLWPSFPLRPPLPCCAPCTPITALSAEVGITIYVLLEWPISKYNKRIKRNNLWVKTTFESLCFNLMCHLLSLHSVKVFKCHAETPCPLPSMSKVVSLFWSLFWSCWESLEGGQANKKKEGFTLQYVYQCVVVFMCIVEVRMLDIHTCLVANVSLFWAGAFSFLV